MSADDFRDEDNLFDSVRGRYCDGLSAEELEQVRDGVREVLKQAEALAAVKLGMSAEPGPLFRPYSANE